MQQQQPQIQQHEHGHAQEHPAADTQRSVQPTPSSRNPAVSSTNTQRPTPSDQYNRHPVADTQHPAQSTPGDKYDRHPEAKRLPRHSPAQRLRWTAMRSTTPRFRVCAFAFAPSRLCFRVCAFAFVLSRLCFRVCAFAFVLQPEPPTSTLVKFRVKFRGCATHRTFGARRNRAASVAAGSSARFDRNTPAALSAAKPLTPSSAEKAVATPSVLSYAQCFFEGRSFGGGRTRILSGVGTEQM
eukprot:262130-Chlamydomonas_euryale.AAC.3